MNTELAIEVRRIIVQRARQDTRIIAGASPKGFLADRILSAELAKRLRATGWELSEGELAAILEDLQQRRTIKLTNERNRDGTPAIGGYSISWVNPLLLDPDILTRIG